MLSLLGESKFIFILFPKKEKDRLLYLLRYSTRKITVRLSMKHILRNLSLLFFNSKLRVSMFWVSLLLTLQGLGFWRLNRLDEGGCPLDPPFTISLFFVQS